MPEALVDDLLAGLNPPQREAVTHPEGPLLVLAGAGSGKTRVLTHRIAWLVHTERARAGEILAITFTNKAAQEMRERVELLLGRSTRAMWVMTFHAACARILRAEAPRLGYTRQFTIYDQADSRRLVKRCIDELDVDPKRFTPGAVQSQISAAKNRLRDAEAYRQLVGSYFEQTVADVYELYERELHRMNAMDFDDLLVRTVNVLELFPEVRARYSAAFRHVLVDEYQDTNPAQYRLLQLVAERAPQPDGGRRRRAVDLRLPRRRHQQHPRLRGRLPGRDDGQARAELPLDADDPRRRQRGDRPQPRARSSSRCGPSWARATRSRSASSTTSTPRRGSSSARSSGWSTRASRSARSPASTGPTRSRGCSRTRSCGARSPTRWSAGRSSTSARRSRTRSPT